MPKELLPIIDKPIIQYVVEEAIAAGITDLIFVTGRTKRAIEGHFDVNLELEVALGAKGKDDIREMVRNIIPKGVNCVFVRQAEPLGLGHAVLCAAPVIGDEPFAVTSIAQKTHLTAAFLKRKIAEYEILKAEIDAVEQEISEDKG